MQYNSCAVQFMIQAGIDYNLANAYEKIALTSPLRLVEDLALGDPAYLGSFLAAPREQVMAIQDCLSKWPVGCCSTAGLSSGVLGEDMYTHQLC